MPCNARLRATWGTTVGTQDVGTIEPRDAPVLCIVDDDDSTVELVREVAEESGWVAVGFGRIEEVRGFLGRHRPSLLVLDDDLPDGRGGDLARELREDPRLMDVPMIVCTAAPRTRQREIGGWAPVMPKPFDVEQLERHLNVTARRRGHRTDRRAAAG